MSGPRLVNTGGPEAQAEGLSLAVGRGASALLLSTLGAKGMNLFAQVALGWLLVREDFGLFAVATSVALVARAFQDTGIQELLLTKSKDEYEELSGSVFWMSMGLNTAAALGLAAAAPAMARLYGLPELTHLLWVIAAGLLFNTPWMLSMVRLSLDLRFADVARISATGAVAQYGLTVLGAWAGLGAMAFVVPLPISAAVRGIYGFVVTRDRPWSRRPAVHRWRLLFCQIRWLIVGSLAFGLFTQGDYLVAGALVPPVVLGVYYFAYQIPAQINMLIAANLQSVLIPTITRLHGQPLRRASAVVRALSSVCLLSGLMSAVLTVTIAPLESLIWRGRWEDAVVPIQILALAFPIRAALSVAKAALLADGRFRAWSILTVVQGMIVVAAASLGAVLHGSATGIALYVSAALALSVAGAVVFAVAPWGVKPQRVLTAALQPWSLAMATALPLLLLPRLGASTLGTSGTALVAGIASAFLYLGAARLFMRQELAGLIKVLPGGAEHLAGRFLRLSTGSGPADDQIEFDVSHNLKGPQ